MPITLLPEPPSRSDPQNFPARADAFMSALPTFAQQANDLAADVNAKQTAAAQAATDAANDAQAASQSEGNAADSASAASTSAATAVAAAGSAQVHRDAAAASALAAATSAASVDIANLSSDYFGPDEPTTTWPGMRWAHTTNPEMTEGYIKRRNAANTGWEIESQLFVPGILVLPTAPTSRLSDVIYVLDRGQILRWQTIGTYTGYASEEVGDFRWGTSITPKPGTELLIGQTIDRTLPKYAALVAWAEVNGHMVAAGDWVEKELNFASVGGNIVRLPDLRNQFIRATGTDADTANARTIGTRQADAVQNITGSFSAGTSASEQGVMGTLVGAFGGIPNKPAIGNATSSGANARATDVTFDASRVARTSSETRGSNTALHPLITL